MPLHDTIGLSTTLSPPLQCWGQGLWSECRTFHCATPPTAEVQVARLATPAGSAVVGRSVQAQIIRCRTWGMETPSRRPVMPGANPGGACLLYTSDAADEEE